MKLASREIPKMNLASLSLEDSLFNLADVRNVARQTGYIEINHAAAANVVSFRHVDYTYHINVYYNTGTIICSLENSFMGRQKFVKRLLTIEEINDLFILPITQSGKEYYYNKNNRMINDSVNEESVELKNISDEMEKQMDFLSTQLQILNGMNSKNNSDNSPKQQAIPSSLNSNYPPPVGRSLVGFKKEQVMSSMGTRMDQVVNKAMSADQGSRNVNRNNMFNGEDNNNDSDGYDEDVGIGNDDDNNGEFSFINKRNIMASINDRMNSTVSSSGNGRDNKIVGDSNEYNSNAGQYNQHPPNTNGFTEGNAIYRNNNDVNRITPRSNNKQTNQYINGGNLSSGSQSGNSQSYNWGQQSGNPNGGLLGNSNYGNPNGPWNNNSGDHGNPTGGPWGNGSNFNQSGPWDNGYTQQNNNFNSTSSADNRTKHNNNTKNFTNSNEDDVGGGASEAKPKALTEKQLKKQKLIQLRNNRGALDDWSLVSSKHFPESMDDIRCVAIAAGGYICIDDEGCASYHGLPSCVVTAVEKHKCKKLKYISIGPLKKGRYGQYQYYLLKTDGTAFFENIPKDLVDEILSQDCNVKYLSLGKYGTYYCLFDNGQAQWNGEIDESLDRLFQSGEKIKSVWFGEKGSYFASYGADQVMHKNIPHKSIKKILANKTKHIKQMLYEYEQDTYFVRYSSVL